MSRKFTILTCLSIMLILSSVIIGCDNDSSGTAENTQQDIAATDLKADDFLDMVANASQEMDTSEIEMDMVMDMKGKAEGENLDLSMSILANVATDIPNKRMKMEMSMEMPEELGSPLVPTNVDMDMYVIDDTMYMNMGDMADMPGGWIKMAIPEDEYSGFEEIWESQNLASEQEKLLFDAAEINIVGERKVNGVNCYEVNIVPDMEQLYDILMSQDMSGYLSEDIDTSDMDAALNLIDDYDITYWYDKSTFQPVKMDIGMTMSNDEGTDISIDMEINMHYKSLNKPVTIKLPSGAKDAVDMSDMMGSEF